MNPADFHLTATVSVPHGTVRFLSRRAGRGHGQSRSAISKDAALLLLHATLTVGSVLLPPSAWPMLCALTAGARTVRPRPRKLSHLAEVMSAVLGPRPDDSVSRLYRRLEGRLHERHMTYIRETRETQPPATRVEGLEDLKASLALGKGAILWNTPALGDTIVTKRALAVAGIHAVQLSVRSHGFSQSRFAVRFLNRRQIDVEDRFLSGRIWFDGADATHATREALRKLGQNRPVIFTNSLHAGRAFVAADILSGTSLLLPTTPLALAVRTGIPLHVVTTIEERPFSSYVTRISPPLADGMARGASTDAAMAQVAVKAAQMLVEALRSHPDQLRLWDRLVRTDALPSG